MLSFLKLLTAPLFSLAPKEPAPPLTDRLEARLNQQDRAQRVRQAEVDYIYKGGGEKQLLLANTFESMLRANRRTVKINILASEGT